MTSQNISKTALRTIYGQVKGERSSCRVFDFGHIMRRNSLLVKLI